MARVHVFLHPDDYDAYRSGEEASGLLSQDNSLVHIDVDESEVTEYAYPLVSIKKVV